MPRGCESHLPSYMRPAGRGDVKNLSQILHLGSSVLHGGVLWPTPIQNCFSTSSSRPAIARPSSIRPGEIAFMNTRAELFVSWEVTQNRLAEPSITFTSSLDSNRSTTLPTWCVESKSHLRSGFTMSSVFHSFTGRKDTAGLR